MRTEEFENLTESEQKNQVETALMCF